MLNTGDIKENGYCKDTHPRFIDLSKAYVSVPMCNFGNYYKKKSYNDIINSAVRPYFKSVLKIETGNKISKGLMVK